jgi:heterodisulfide reductase subunit A-like polyferredoxin
MLGVRATVYLALSCLRSAVAYQAIFSASLVGHPQNLDESHEFPHPIRRVAVIGAGANGLLHTAALLEAGFEVRMFERAPRPGGTWNYNEKKPVPASFPYVLFPETGPSFLIGAYLIR